MELKPVSLLMLLAAVLIEGQQPGWYRIKHLPRNYSQQPGLGGWKSEPRTMTQQSNGVQLNHALKPVKAPAKLFPLAFAQSADVNPGLSHLQMQSMVQTEAQNPVLMPVQNPPPPMQIEGRHPYQSPLQPRTYPVLMPPQSPAQAVGQFPNYRHSPPQTEVPSAVMMPIQSSYKAAAPPSPGWPRTQPLSPQRSQVVGQLPTYRQSPAQTDGPQPAHASLQMGVHVPAQPAPLQVGFPTYVQAPLQSLVQYSQSPAQMPVQMPHQPRFIGNGPSQTHANYMQNLVHDVMPNPKLMPVQSPTQASLQEALHDLYQSPVWTNILPMLMPQQSLAQDEGGLSTYRQSPAHTDEPQPVLMPAQSPVHAPLGMEVHVPAQALSSQTEVPVPAQALLSQTEVPVPAQALPSQTEVPVPAQALPSQTEVPVPAQALPSQTEVPVPAQAPPSQTEVPVPAQAPPSQTGVPVPAQAPPSQTGVPVPAQALLQSSVQTAQSPDQAPVQTPVHGTAQAHSSHRENHVHDVVLNPQLLPVQRHAQGPVQSAIRGPISGEVPEAVLDSAQAQQDLSAPQKSLTWRYPQIPERPKQPPIHFDLQQPVPASSVAAACGEKMAHVEVKQDLFGNGQLITPTALTLGGCALAGQDTAAHVLIFESELHSCGSVLMMIEDQLVYRFTLNYNPTPFVGTPIIRTAAVSIFVECHYPRKHNISSNVVKPVWTPYASTVVAEDHLIFILKLMTDDWKFERPSNKYILGDFMHIEASFIQYNHAPLRIYVDNCVATTVLDVTAVPRYSFIENHGCLVDSKVTGSGSQFMPHVQNDKLQFQLEVFKFEQDNTGLIYITCSMKATAALYRSDNEHKACSFTANGWVATDGDNQVCSCCDANCGSKKERSVSEEDLYFEGTASLGPVFVEEIESFYGSV